MPSKLWKGAKVSHCAGHFGILTSLNCTTKHYLYNTIEGVPRGVLSLITITIEASTEWFKYLITSNVLKPTIYFHENSSIFYRQPRAHCWKTSTETLGISFSGECSLQGKDRCHILSVSLFFAQHTLLFDLAFLTLVLSKATISRFNSAHARPSIPHHQVPLTT